MIVNCFLRLQPTSCFPYLPSAISFSRPPSSSPTFYFHLISVCAYMRVHILKFTGVECCGPRQASWSCSSQTKFPIISFVLYYAQCYHLFLLLLLLLLLLLQFYMIFAAADEQQLIDAFSISPLVTFKYYIKYILKYLDPCGINTIVLKSSFKICIGPKLFVCFVLYVCSCGCVL